MEQLPKYRGSQVGASKSDLEKRVGLVEVEMLPGENNLDEETIRKIAKGQKTERDSSFL